MTEKHGKNHKFSRKIKSIWMKFLSFFKKDSTPGSKKLKMHSKFGALVAIQYRDKIDTSWTKSIKTIIQKVVFSVLKFVVIFVVVALMLRVVSVLFMISKQIMDFFMIFLGVYSILNLISVTVGLVKSLYHAEDNKVLATYPISSTKLFLSKIIVFELFELKKSFDILLPISLGFIFAGVQKGVIPNIVLVWSILPLFLIITVTVLVGALLSIPALFIYNFLKKYPIIQGILVVAITSAVVIGIVSIINLIPESIDLHVSYGVIKTGIENFSRIFSQYVYPISYAYKAIVGESIENILMNKLTLLTFARFLIILGSAGILFGLVFLIIKPFYFGMMTKTFEFNKDKVDDIRKNKKREKHWAIIVKEIKLTLRDFDISGSYLIVYIAVPIMLLFIDKVFAAMSTNSRGDFMIAAFNVLLIMLPLLASSTVISTVYSREGRTAYLKKTKPIKPYFPLTAKLLFNLIFVIPSIIVSSYVFVKFTKQDTLCAVLLAITIFGFQYGHIFYSASLDIMNPQNELYATEGSSFANPNERKSTIVGFVLSLFITALAFFLFSESQAKYGNLDAAFVKLMILGLAFGISTALLFYLKIRAFYIDRQEATKE